MTTKRRVEALEENTIYPDKEIVFETETLRKLQAKLKARNEPTKPFNLKEIQKKMMHQVL